MTSNKRKQRPVSSDELLSLESLKGLNTQSFWQQTNAIELAEDSIIKIVQTSRNNKTLLPILLPFVAAHVIKMSSSNRKGASFCVGGLTETFRLLVEENSTDVAVERFLHTNIHYVQHFPAGLKKALLSVLVHKELAPSPMVHKDLLLKWLEALLSKEGTTCSWALLGCLEALLKQGSAELPLVASLVEMVINGSSVINVLWPRLWAAVGSRPTLAGKKLGLALCRYACMATVDDDIVLAPTLLLGNQGAAAEEQSHTSVVAVRNCGQSDGGALFVSIRKVINALLHEAGHLTISNERESVPIVHGASLFPLVLICHLEQDAGIRTNALQLLVSSAPQVLARSGPGLIAISAEQIVDHVNTDEDIDEGPALAQVDVLLQTSMSIWTAVVSSIAVSLDVDNRKIKSNKTAQHKALVALCSLLEKNPFTRKFQRNCTARQATALIHTELSAAAQSSTVDAASIVFLREELSFLSILQNKVVPLVVRVVERAFLQGLAARDMTLVETVLESRCLGLDATLVVATLERLPTGAMRDMLMSVVHKRCFHVSAVTELAEAVLDDGSNNNNSNSSHFQKTAAYGSLMQLVGLMVQHGDTASAATLTLAEELRALLIVSADAPGTNNRIEPVLLSLSALLHQQAFASSRVAPPQAMSTSTTAHVLSTKICRKFIQSHLTALVAAAKAQKVVNNNDGLSRDTQHARLRIALWLKLVMEVTQGLPADDKERLQAAVFPDMLLEPTTMPIAVQLALQLDASKPTTNGSSSRLLFESVAYLQDSALEPEWEGEQAVTRTSTVVQYINLLATVVTENARVVRARVKEHFKPSKGDVNETMTAERRGGQEDTTDQDCQEQDYMAVASATEELAVLTEQALEKSVGPGEFLSCFIPFLQHLVLALGTPVPEAVRIAALRALGTYMTTSSAVLKGNIAGVEAMIVDVHAARANPNSSSSSSSSDTYQPLHGLHSEAVVTWVSCFHPSTCDVSVLARGLVRALNDNHCDESTGMFVRIVLRSLHHLLVQNLVRNPAEIVATLALPLALNAPPTVQQMSHDILDETFQRNAKLAAQALYQLCLVPLTESSSSSSSSSSRSTHTHQSISRYLFDALTESQRFALVKAIVNAAKLIADNDNKDMEEGGDEGDGAVVGPSSSSSSTKEEPLLSEVDRALTIDVLRSGSSFVMRALQLLDTTEESVHAMRSAVELGTIRNLPSDVGQQIIQRLGVAANSNGRTNGKKKSGVKGNRKKKPTK